MKSGTLTCIATMTLFAALAAPFHLAAQPETGLASLPLDAQAGISAQLAKLTASDGAAFDHLGWSVAVSGDTVVVGTWLARIGSEFVPSGSGVHLTHAVSINDRGEIASVRLLPNGDQHTFLLVPCGEGDAACSDSAASTTTRGSLALVAQPRTIAALANPPLSGRGMLDRLRAGRFPGRRSLGPASGPTR